jgi:Transglycosylase SLT domain/SPOR domain
MIRACVALLLAVPVWLVPAGIGVAATPPLGPMEPLDHAICRLIERSASADHLPVAFLTRIIWRESSFRASVVSPAGAEGIAQFMPQTAHERGLANPFDPEQAIPKAAALLADLRRQFGSLGVAAAAYNAGPGRVASWLRGEADLPAVTHAYVRFVTAEGSGGTSPAPASDLDPEPPGAPSCLAVTAALRRDRGDGSEADADFAPLAPWGVQLAGNFSKAVALAAFERHRRHYAAVIGDLQPMIIGRLLRSRGTRRFYQVRLPAASRADADLLCRRIHAAGGACIALRS